MTIVNSSRSLVLAALRRHPWFEGVPEAALGTLAAHSRWLPFKAGDTLFSEGQSATSCLLVCAGLVQGLRYTADGGDKVFYTTGRLTSEMVMKSAQMGVPIVVSRSGITQMGLDVAQRVGLCAIGRAIMSNPNIVLLDEPSMGLAPQIVEEVFNIVKDLNTKEGTTFLLAEQNTNMALKYADYGYIMESGRIMMDGAAKDLANNEDVKEFYLGMGGGERKSFKDVKSYKRRKRWLA